MNTAKEAEDSEIPESFWKLIALAGSDLPAFQAALQEMDEEVLIDLYWTFEEAAGLLKEAPYTNHMSPQLSEDGVDDVATWVVAQGKEFYTRVVNDPKQVPPRAEKRTGLLGEIVEAYEDRFGGPIPFPDEVEDRE